MRQKEVVVVPSMGSSKGKWSGKRKDGIAGAAVAVMLGWLFFVSPLGERLIHLSYELPFLFRSDIKVDEAVVLYMDDDSHEKLGQKYDRPWDRSLHARLIERLDAMGARAVVLDILFETASNEASDQQLAHAVRSHGKVVVARKVVPHIINGEVIGMKLTQLFTNAFPWGVAEASGEDKTVRQHYRDRISDAPTLAWTAARLTMADPPADKSLARWVNYYGPPGTIPFYSYYQVLSNAIPPAAVSNKVVFVGAQYSVGFTGGLGTDDYRTPYTRWTGRKSPGVEINATTYLNLLRDDWLVEAPRAWEWIVLTLFGIALGFGLAGCKPVAGAGIGAATAMFVGLAAILTVWQSHVWFPWLLVVGIQMPAALFWSVFANTRSLQREKEVLARKLAAPKPAIPIPFPFNPPAQPFPAAAGGGGEAKGPAPPFVPDHALLRCVGQGSYGHVWLARDVIGSYHAVKIIYRNSFKEADPYEREFHGIQRFTPISRSHPGFVNILQVGRNDESGYFYYVMEAGDDIVHGQQIEPGSYTPKNLARELSQRGRLAVDEALGLGLNLSAALDHLHQHHLVHRDIKPSNIIFVNGQPKFADIGLVTDLAETGRNGSYVGTEGYIPPEGPGAAAADVYSLGKVIYEASTGLDRKDFPNLPDWMVQCDGNTLLFQLNKIILRACETDLRKRYRSAAEMHQDLLRLVQNKTLRKKGRFWPWRSQCPAAPQSS